METLFLEDDLELYFQNGSAVCGLGLWVLVLGALGFGSAGAELQRENA